MVTAAAVLFITAGPAHASGGAGGGGGGPVVQLQGNWSGSISFPAPPQLLAAALTLSQGSSGMLSGQLCTPLCAAASGRVNTDGTFEIRGETYILKGALVGTTMCTDGTVGRWISGSVQERGSSGSFSFTDCH